MIGVKDLYNLGMFQNMIEGNKVLGTFCIYVD